MPSTRWLPPLTWPQMKEENALLPGTSARPADIFILSWTGGRDTALDVPVVYPLLTDTLINSITTAGHQKL